MLPEENEAHMTVFKLNKTSSSGSDVFTGAFYQCCWDIIGEDITS